MRNWDTADDARRAMTDAQTRVLGRKFCRTCQSMKPLEGATEKLLADGRRAFLCAGCTERIRTRRSK